MKRFLETIVKKAGEISLGFKARLGEVRVSRKSEKDLVTEADVAVEKFLIGEIQRRYPGHGIVGEETGTHAGGGSREGGEWRWIIDPIDGTGSFVHDLPFYSISVGVERGGEMALGAVNGPVLGELFMAEKGAGATLNGKPIHVSKCGKLSDAMLGTGFACLREDLEQNNLPYFGAIAPKIRGVRRHGSAAMDLSYVACGRFDGFWEMDLKIYDIAAGMLIVREAGGTVTDFSGTGTEKMPGEILATNGRLHGEVAGIMGEVRRRGA